MPWIVEADAASFDEEIAAGRPEIDRPVGAVSPTVPRTALEQHLGAAPLGG